MNTTISSNPLDASAASWWKRRTGLIVPAVVLAVGTVLIIGSVTMVVPSTATFPGPRVFPLLVAGGAIVMALLLAIDTIRHPEPRYTRLQAHARGIDDGRTSVLSTVNTAGVQEDIAPTDDETIPLRPRSNVRAILGVLGALIIFIAALEPVGWLLTTSFLFWAMARALGSRRYIFDIFVGFAISAILQLAFSAGLGLHLPPGILEGSLSWIR